MYAVVYLGNPKNETVRTRMELASDDSILVKLDDCEVFQRRVNRSFAESGTVQDAVAVEIAPGSHRLLVKAFNNSGDFGFRLRFTDPSTGAPITDTTTPAIRSSLVPEDLGVKLIKPVGLELRREVTPELVIGLDKVSHVVLKALVTFAKLDGATRVTVRERLPGGTLLEPGSARPVPSSQEGNLITWELSVEEVLHDIHYDVARRLLTKAGLANGNSAAYCFRGIRATKAAISEGLPE